MPSPSTEPIQTTLDVGVPLSDVTFCVVDLETTGGSPADDAITEIGAVKFRGGERLGSFRALVNPQRPIPPYIAHLTGIDDRLVSGRTSDRAGPAGVPRVLPRLGLRGPQRGVRLRLPERELRRARLPRAPRSTPVHGAARPPRGLARRPQREARDPRELLQDAGQAHPSRARRRGGVRRGAARPARSRRTPRHHHDGRPHRGASGPGGARTSARSGSPTICRTRRASTSSVPATGGCSTWARPPTCAPA